LARFNLSRLITPIGIASSVAKSGEKASANQGETVLAAELTGGGDAFAHADALRVCGAF